jgi:NTE family protein
MKIGIALGGGGARGLAHILMLEVFDELGIRPHCIAGTSMGAVIGALYASGMSASAILEHVNTIVGSQMAPRQGLRNIKAILKWIELKDFELGSHGVFTGDRFVQRMCETMGVTDFKDLKIPLKVVATDFWASKQVVLDAGALVPAIRASMGLPGLFTPIRVKGRVLMDGGGVNPVPHDVITDCDAVVAIDVMGYLDGGEKRPHMFRSIMGMFDIMQNTIIAEKRKASPPDIYIKPEIYNVDLLEFDKVRHVLLQAEPAREKLKSKLAMLLKRG